MSQPTWLSYGDATNTVRIIGILIPLVTALITRSTASKRVKSITTTVLSILAGSAVYLVASDGHGYNWAGFVNAILNTFVAAIASYYGLHKPTGLAPALARKTASVGIGDPTGEAADGARDAGQTFIGTIGAVLLLIGVIFLVLALLKVATIASFSVCIVLIIIGACLYFFDRGRL